METDLMDIPEAAFTDEKTLKYTQQQLTMIVHASKCQRRQILANSSELVCLMRQCTKMQELFLHMMKCTEPQECSRKSCSPVRRIINHWRFCVKKDCPVCSILLEGNSPVPKDWHKSLAVGERNHLVDLLLYNYCAQPHSLDGVVTSVVYAKEIEEEAFNEANSLAEYHHIVAEQLWLMELQDPVGGVWWNRYQQEYDVPPQQEADLEVIREWAEESCRYMDAMGFEYVIY